MKIFVTGATGFIGSHFVEQALARGHEIAGGYSSEQVAKRPVLQRLRDLGAKLQRVDILDAASIAPALHGSECICHFAGAFRESGATDEYFYRMNVVGTGNVLKAGAAAGVRRFVFCSTAGIHGQRVAETVTERSPLRPFNAYETSKVAAEAEVRALATEHAMEYVIVRPTAVYGPRDERLLKMFRSAAKGRFPLFGKGLGRRHMVYVTDLAEAFLAACTSPAAAGQDFIAAGPRAAPLVEMLTLLAEVVGRKSAGPSLPLRPMLALAAVTEDLCRPLGLNPPLYRRRMDFYVNDAAFDTGKAAALLGWRPTTDLPKGLKATFASYRAEGLI